MLGRLLLIFSSMHVAYAISIQLQQTWLRFVKNRAKRCCQRIRGEDRISALPDDLLMHILLFLPGTKDVVATMILSKRWRSIWTMVPRLGYYDDTHKVFTGGLFGRLLGRLFDKSEQQQRCLWRFIDKSLQLHKAHVLESLLIKLGPSGDHVDVGKWIAIAVARRVRELTLMITWSAEPASLSKSLYTCDTLVELHLSNNIIVDDPSRVVWCNANIFSKLMECKVTLLAELDWLESLMGLLQNSPNLKVLFINQTLIDLMRISHFHGRNRVLFPDVSQLISRYLIGKDI
ncbi:putative FBD-associated F-box protein At1g05080 isoform X2 [Arabidopsis lyrata subsp. lyrata]|uniref:putative FBD-associated F-box protein At1g05080 isoform X2 n=1 Tax=Arabidopsis lyrata subsp. lyrata TaxID=81972 RepID=UPI000A29BE06|nr:putative FBD-associated F-box protein At1g05080 isoform X2 [Arabidopsis lyrata subsp. lyrata]|eukprot:XP_020878748.1 putative FBD-associated F-box protein At1g05080 isoform X2 [Arabidopsis lyrata subsp. lyrata]